MQPVTQEPQEPSNPSWPPSGWLTKQTAAERLNLSQSRVFAIGEAGKIKTQRVKSPSSGQWVTLFHAGDVERVIYDRENPSRVPAKVDKLEIDPLSELFQKTGLMSVRGLPAVKQEVQKPWITISEAAEVSGLPASTIESLVKSKRLLALDCGPRPGGRYRIKRADLDALEAK